MTFRPANSYCFSTLAFVEPSEFTLVSFVSASFVTTVMATAAVFMIVAMGSNPVASVSYAVFLSEQKYVICSPMPDFLEKQLAVPLEAVGRMYSTLGIVDY